MPNIIGKVGLKESLPEVGASGLFVYCTDSGELFIDYDGAEGTPTRGPVKMAGESYISAVEISDDSKGIKVTKGDGSETSIPIVTDMVGASSEAAGSAGYVPAPAMGDEGKFLRGDGTWQEVNASLESMGVTATADELNYISGVTSNVQTQLNDKLSTTGTAAAASKLATARTITLAGDVTGSASFDGSGNITITCTVVDDSHNHTIANVDNLQSQLNTISSNASSAKSVTDKYSAMLNIIGNGQ